MKQTFREYIDEKMEGELMMAFSLDDLREDWGITLSELFFCLSSLGKYHLKKHPDLDWHIILVDKMKARSIREREKDRQSRC